MNRIDAVAVDLDGTLLDKGGVIVDEARLALFAAHDRGVAVFVVTGRPLEDVLGFLAHNGLAGTPIPDAIAAEERDLYDRAGNTFTSQEGRNRRQYVCEHEMSQALSPFVRAAFPELGAIDPGFTCCDEETVRRRGFIEFRFTSVEGAAQGAALLAATLAGHAEPPQIVRNQRGVSLRHPSAGKGHTLAQLALDRGLEAARILAIGDSENDRSMLDGRFGFLAAAPANADPAIQELVLARGGYVCRESRGRGVAEAIGVMLA